MKRPSRFRLPCSFSPSSRLPCAALAVLALVCFARLVAMPDGWLVDGDRPSADGASRIGSPRVGNDLTRFQLPKLWRIVAALRREGRPPLWDRFAFGGRPFLGNPQAGLFYPPYWIAWLLPFGATLSWLTVAHLIWGGLGAYRLARLQGLSRFAATVAGGCFEASPYLLAQSFEGHSPHVWAASWYPWAFAEALRLRRGDRRGGWLLPPILALAFFTGHPQEFYLLSLCLAAWAVFEAIQKAKRGLVSSAVRELSAWSLVAATTAGLIAVEIGPIAAVRASIGREPGDSLATADQYHVDPIDLLQLFHPFALGGPADFRGSVNYWETLLSFGWIPLVLAFWAARYSTERAPVRGWTALAIAAILFAAGRKLGLFIILYECVPGLRYFRVPARSLFLASLAVASLAGFGVQAWIDRSASEESRRLGAIRTRFFAVSALPLSLFPRFEFLREPIFLSAAAGIALAFEVFRRSAENGKKAAWIVGVLAMAELSAHAVSLLRVSPAERFLGRDPVAEAIARARPIGPFRIRARDVFYDDALAVRAGLEKTNADDLFQIERSADLYRTLYPMFQPNNPHAREGVEVRRAMLDRFGVAFLVTDHPEPNAPWPLRESGRWDRHTNYYIYQNATAMPRAYVVPRAIVAPDEPRLATELLPAISPRSAVVMSVDPLRGKSARRQPFQPCESIEVADDRLAVRTSTEAPGLLVICETWMPGWSASLDGRPVEIFRGDRAWRVIALPDPGRHVVVMTYEPPGFKLGLAITAATFLVWSGAFLGRSFSPRFFG